METKPEAKITAEACQKDHTTMEKAKDVVKSNPLLIGVFFVAGVGAGLLSGYLGFRQTSDVSTQTTESTTESAAESAAE
jgi:hypothetical protein